MDVNELYDMLETQLNTYEAGFARDIYQHSLYLTRAQDIYYDTILANFEETNTVSEMIDSLLSSVDITTFTIDKFGGNVADFGILVRKILRERVTFTDDTETIAVYRGDTMQVREERLAEIESSLENPFRVPGEHFVLRAIEESTTFSKSSVYTPVGTKIAKYTVTLGIEPEPIILEALPDGLTIRSKSDATTVFQFKDKDLEKIVEIAVGLILKDASAFADRARQGVEAIGEGTPKTSTEDALRVVDGVAAQTQRAPKVETGRAGGNAEHVLSAVEAMAAAAPKHAKVASENAPGLTEFTLSALEQQMLAQPKKG